MIMKNYYKYYIPCEMFESFRAELRYTPAINRSVAQPYYTSLMLSSIRHLIISIYNQTDNYLSAILPKYQALLSSLCFVPMIQTPFDKNFNYKNYNIKPQKYISAKRFNYLTYKILNHFSKYFYNLISSSQINPCIEVLNVVNCNMTRKGYYEI